jgi:hypothetical protein
MMLRPLLASGPTISRPAVFKVAISRVASVLAAALALATLPAASDAVAAHYGGHDGGFRGGFHHPGGFQAHPGFAVHRSPAFRGVYHHRPFARRFFFNGHYHYYYYGCYRWRYVATPWGWRLRRVNVCYPSYYRYY